MMQLISPTPMKAPRQARNASPSSERRTPGTAAIGPNLFKAGDSPDLSANYKNKECLIIANLAASVQRSRVNLNDAAGCPLWDRSQFEAIGGNGPLLNRSNSLTRGLRR